MRHPQLLVYESDGRLAGLLKETARALKWAFREPRQPEACLCLLQHGSPSVLVLRVSSDSPRDTAERTARHASHELVLLERVAWLFPDTRTVMVCDHQTELAGLAWDLGADFVLGPTVPREQLSSIVVGLMEAVAGRHADVVAEG